MSKRRITIHSPDCATMGTRAVKNGKFTSQPASCTCGATKSRKRNQKRKILTGNEARLVGHATFLNRFGF